jgi:hypothetical protein
MSSDNKKSVNDLINKILTRVRRGSVSKRNDTSSNSFQVLGSLIKAIENPAEQADNKKYQETLKSLQEIVNNAASNLVKDKIAEIGQAPAASVSQETEKNADSEATNEEKSVELTPEQLAKIQSHLQQKIEEQLKQILPNIVETQLNDNNNQAPVAVSVEPTENNQVPVDTENSAEDKPAEKTAQPEKEEIQELVEFQMRELIDKLVPEIVKEKQAEAPKQEDEVKEAEPVIEASQQAPEVPETSHDSVKQATNNEQDVKAEADNNKEAPKPSVQDKLEGMVDEKLPVIVDEKLADIVEQKLAEQLIKEEKKQHEANGEVQADKQPEAEAKVENVDQEAT